MSRLDAIISRIEQARLRFSQHHIVHLVAVSKYTTDAKILELYNQGQRAFGESKVQDLEAKQQELNDYPLEWHFIGNIQTNKINKLIDLEPTLIHSIDSLKTAEEFEKRLRVKGKKQKALLQINSANEESKSGVSPKEALDIYQQITSTSTHLELVGVMSFGAHTDDQKAIQKSFETTRKIFDEIKDARFCSMGMSGDFELAIECGSNMLRIGSILFE